MTHAIRPRVPRYCRRAHAILTPGLSPTVDPLSSQAMHRDHQCWYSHRLNRHMGVAIYGNYGGPILAFPTSCGDEWEMEGQSMIRPSSTYGVRVGIMLWPSISHSSPQLVGKARMGPP